jgi:hypothetical protein
MAFTEDLSVFLDLNGFGVPVVAGAVSGVGILDANVELFYDGGSKFIDYMLTASHEIFGNVSRGESITVDGKNYKVLETPDPYDDEAFCRIHLKKITAAAVPLVSRIFRTGSGMVLRSGAGRALQTQSS